MPKTQFPSSHQYTVPAKRIIAALFALLIFFLLLMSVIRLAEKYFAVRNRNKELTEQGTELQQKENALVTTNAYLSSPQGTEQSLRERFNYVKPGEGMIIISPQPTLTPPPSQSTVSRWWDELLHGLGIRK
jgi:cell division protein FtsB